MVFRQNERPWLLGLRAVSGPGFDRAKRFSPFSKIFATDDLDVQAAVGLIKQKLNLDEADRPFLEAAGAADAGSPTDSSVAQVFRHRVV